MIIFKLQNGETLKFNFSNSQKEKELFEFWNSIVNKKIKLKTEVNEIEIKIKDIDECLIGEEAENFIKQTSDFHSSNIDDGLNFLKNMFKI